MQSYSIVTGSVTYAIKGRDILRRHGFNARIEKITDKMQNVGCAYAVVIKGNIDTAQSLLQNAGVKILQIIK